MKIAKRRLIRLIIGLSATLAGVVISQMPGMLTEALPRLSDPQFVAIFGVLLFNGGVFLALSVVPSVENEPEGTVDVQNLLDWYEDCDRHEADRQARLNTLHYDEFRFRSK